MFAEQVRRAIAVTPRAKLCELSGALWKAHAAGMVPDDEAQALSDLIAARKALPATQKPVQRRVGSRPRSPASLERRRRWASSGAMPPHLAARFTLAEAAVLAVVAAEVRTKGSCTLTIGHIAALAGVCRKTVKNALREAEALGFVRVEERRLTAWRNAPNCVTITSPEWHAWMRMRRRGEGVKAYPPRIPKERKGAPSAQRAADERAGLRSELQRGGSSPALSFPPVSGGWRA